LKTYRPTREVLAEIEALLASNRPAPNHSPLHGVIAALCSARHYTWVGIYLTAGEKSPSQLVDSASDGHPGQLSSSDVKSKILVTMKLASREIGVLDAESDREDAFGPEDRVLLERAANSLALFLTGRGKYLVRRAKDGYVQGKP
jgi:putative methionine-R-sulfoxide reductase with GAF domain